MATRDLPEIDPADIHGYKGPLDMDSGLITAMGMDFNSPAVHMQLTNPGVYLDAHGRIVSEEAARRAGFDIEYWARQRRAREREAQMDRELEQIKQKMREVDEAQSISKEAIDRVPGPPAMNTPDERADFLRKAEVI